MLICAHLGRPKGEDFAERAAAGPSLRPVADRLGELLGQAVALAADVAGPSARQVAADLGDGDVALLENVRFEPAETAKDDAQRAEFAAKLAALATCYVGDGFGALHRKHASVYDVPGLLPHAAGRAGAEGNRGAAQPDREPGAPLRRRARRRQAVGQARGDREPARQGRPADHRRRHVVHVPGRPGLRGRQVAARARPDRQRASGPGRCQAAGRRDRAAGRPGRRDRLRRRRRARGLPGRRLPGRPGEPGHGTAHQGAVRQPSWPTPRPSSGTARSGVFEFPAFAAGTRARGRGDQPACTG